MKENKQTELNDYLDHNATIIAVEEAMLKKKSEEKSRNYLGMSQIGEDCWRKLWYYFRQVSDRNYHINSVLSAEDGYSQEKIMAERLRLIPEIELITEIDGKQIAYNHFGGLFAGHCDGHIQGIIEAPKTIHIWENKAVDEKKFNKLNELILKLGEKEALEKWDYTYYCQAQIYMYSAGLERHYLTVETSGGRKMTSCRTNLNKKIALRLIEKARDIIKSDRPLAKISDNEEFYLCRWCDYKEICHSNKIPDVNCRTCAFSEPDLEAGAWVCHKKKEIEKPCNQHLFLNTFVPFKVIDVDKKNNIPEWIKYRIDEEKTFFNATEIALKNPASFNLTSLEIKEKEYFDKIKEG